MAIALSIGEQWDYILKADRDLPKEKQTVWHLAHLDPDELASLNDGAAKYEQATETIGICAGTSQLNALRIGLKGWSNFFDPDGNEVAYDTNGTKLQIPGIRGKPRDYISNASLQRVHPKMRAELADAVHSAGILDEDDLKN